MIAWAETADGWRLELRRTEDRGPSLPRLEIRRQPDTIFEYRYDDFEVVGYQSHPAIKAPIAV